MITRIDLTNFKCFRDLRLELGKVTLLTGFNAAGKSTAIQSILLLAQTLRNKERGADLWLNGPLLCLGSPGDVINQDQSANEIALGFSTEHVTIHWQMQSVEREDDRVLRVVTVRMQDEHGERVTEAAGQLTRLLPDQLHNDQTFADAISAVQNTVYVSAVRQVETDVFPMPEDPDPIHADVGTYGEYAPWWFHQYDDADIDPRRCVAGSENPRTLRGQVNGWLGELFPGAEVNAQPVPKTRLMRLELRTGKTDEWRRPSNIGYGLSYAFPLLVAGLAANPHQLLIVDSPEAHLHPQGQSRMGRFLAQVAASGVQIIVETHSDHILNGFRMALKEQIIAPDDAAIYFFNAERSADNVQPPVTAVRADRNGNLSDWPKGFFDQAENDLASLAGWA